MKRISMTIVLAATLALLAYACSRPVQTTSSSEKTIAALNRVNRYFHNAVVTPKLRDCWNRLQGEGVIAIDFTYRKSGSSWAFERIGVIKSTLPKGQDAVALQCMQDSVRGTSFSVEKADSPETSAERFVVRWTWPVPLPPEGSQIGRMINGGPTDTQMCQTCEFRGRYPYGMECRLATSGYMDCRSDINTPNVCSTGPACLTGIYGTSAGMFIY